MNVKRVLFPTDFSPTSRDAFLAAVDIAKAWKAELTLVHVLEPISFTLTDDIVAPAWYERLLGEVKASLQALTDEAQKLGAPAVVMRVLEGAPWRSIVEEARRGGHDLVVIATHGRTGLNHVLLGSVAERVVRHAPCAVLVTRAMLDRLSD